MFGVKDGKPTYVAKRICAAPRKKVNNPKLIRNIEEHNEKKTSASSTRTVSKATIEKWKIEVVNYSVNDCFEYIEDREGNPTSMRCKYCVMFEDKIKHIDGFTNQYIVGSTNF